MGDSTSRVGLTVYSGGVKMYRLGMRGCRVGVR